MVTYIIPGFSIQNKAWAEETKAKIEPEFPATVYYWQHWTTGAAEKGWITIEASRITQKIISGEKDYSIIAKSIGTAVASEVLGMAAARPKKIILCGVPINDFLLGTDRFYESLKAISPQNILCLQNETDPHGSFAQAKEFYAKINPAIKVVSTPRSDHEYPFFEDFKKFLTN